MRQIFLAGFELPDRIDIAARQRGLVRLERHRLAQFAGADQFGFALDDAEQRAHDIHQILGELTRIDGGFGRFRVGLRVRRDFCQGVRELGIRTAVEHRHHRLGRHAAGGRVDQARWHHITSMSAWIAPAALIACRMPIKSRGPMPSPLRPSTSCCSDTPSLTTASFLPSSLSPTLERAVTTLLPPDIALDRLTCGLSEILTVTLPSAPAPSPTLPSRHIPPIL